MRIVLLGEGLYALAARVTGCSICGDGALGEGRSGAWAVGVAGCSIVGWLGVPLWGGRVYRCGVAGCTVVE